MSSTHLGNDRIVSFLAEGTVLGSRQGLKEAQEEQKRTMCFKWNEIKVKLKGQGGGQDCHGW